MPKRWYDTASWCLQCSSCRCSHRNSAWRGRGRAVLRFERSGQSDQLLQQSVEVVAERSRDPSSGIQTRCCIFASISSITVRHSVHGRRRGASRGHERRHVLVACHVGFHLATAGARLRCRPGFEGLPCCSRTCPSARKDMPSRQPCSPASMQVNPSNVRRSRRCVSVSVRAVASSSAVGDNDGARTRGGCGRHAGDPRTSPFSSPLRTATS